MSAYSEWGFSDNPFKTSALEANATGSHLLVGREEQVDLIVSRLDYPDKIVVIDGRQGIGKTSLVNIASFRKSIASSGGRRFLPAMSIIQLDAHESMSKFSSRVLRIVGATVLGFVEQNPNLKDQFGSDFPRLKSILQGTGPSANYSLNLGPLTVQSSQSTGTSAEFTDAEYEQVLRGVLQSGWRTEDSGGVVCLLDNLELADTSENARRLLDQLRDSLFAFPRLRWIVSGSLGVVNGLRMSNRFSGKLHETIEVGPISGTPERILNSRVDSFKAAASTYLPISEASFASLFHAVRGNTRVLLSNAGDYCIWCHESHRKPLNDAAKAALFDEWRSRRSEQTLASIRQSIGDAAWRVFDKAVELGGSFSPSEFAVFGYQTMPSLRVQVKALENARLVTVSKADNTDARRRTVSLTEQAWFVAINRPRA
jgi:hypothetical protein